MRKRVTDFDVRLGARIRAARKVRGFSIQKLADATDVSFQQVQKLEAGVNRCPPERLVQIAEFLSVSPSGLLLDGEDKEAETVVARITRPRGTTSTALLAHIAIIADHGRTDMIRALEEVARVMATAACVVADDNPFHPESPEGRAWEAEHVSA